MKLLPIALLLFNVAAAQVSTKSHGTLISAAICKDGIVMYADSRAVWTGMNPMNNKEVRVIAYVDGTKKLFPIGNYIIGISGANGIKDDFWESIITEYSRVNKNNLGIYETLKSLRTFVINKYKISDAEVRDSHFVIAGYEAGRPLIIYSDATKDSQASKIGRVYFSEPDAAQYMRKNDSTMQGMRVSIESVYDSAYKYSRHIGAPIMAVRIDASKIEVFRSFKPLYFKTYTEYVKAILAKKVKVHYFPPEGNENALFDALRESLKSGVWN